MIDKQRLLSFPRPRARFGNDGCAPYRVTATWAPENELSSVQRIEVFHQRPTAHATNHFAWFAQKFRKYCATAFSSCSVSGNTSLVIPACD
jgi:hypothetical protein